MRSINAKEIIKVNKFLLKEFDECWNKAFKNLTAKKGKWFIEPNKHHLILRRFAGFRQHLINSWKHLEDEKYRFNS